MIVFFGRVGELTLALSHDSSSTDDDVLWRIFLFSLFGVFIGRVAGGGGGENRLAFRGSRGSVRDLKIRILVVSSGTRSF